MTLSVGENERLKLFSPLRINMFYNIVWTRRVLRSLLKRKLYHFLMKSSSAPALENSQSMNWLTAIVCLESEHWRHDANADSITLGDLMSYFALDSSISLHQLSWYLSHFKHFPPPQRDWYWQKFVTPLRSIQKEKPGLMMCHTNTYINLDLHESSQGDLYLNALACSSFNRNFKTAISLQSDRETPMKCK